MSETHKGLAPLSPEAQAMVDRVLEACARNSNGFLVRYDTPDEAPGFEMVQKGYARVTLLTLRGFFIR